MRVVPVRRRLATALLTAALALTLAGCGFQPRGQVHGAGDLPSPLYISGIERYSALHREFRKQLERSGVALADSSDASRAVLRIHNYERDNRVLSVDNRNKTVERELEESIRFTLRRPDREASSDAQTIRVLRILLSPSDSVLGSRNEADLLRADMRTELAQRVLQRVAAQY